MTNYEKIMAEMTPEKLAALMVKQDWKYDDTGITDIYRVSFEDRCYYLGREHAEADQLDWLNSEAKDGDE